MLPRKRENAKLNSQSLFRSVGNIGNDQLITFEGFDDAEADVTIQDARNTEEFE